MTTILMYCLLTAKMVLSAFKVWMNWCLMQIHLHRVRPRKPINIDGRQLTAWQLEGEFVSFDVMMKITLILLLLEE